MQSCSDDGAALKSNTLDAHATTPTSWDQWRGPWTPPTVWCAVGGICMSISDILCRYRACFYHFTGTVPYVSQSGETENLFLSPMGIFNCFPRYPSGLRTIRRIGRLVV